MSKQRNTRAIQRIEQELKDFFSDIPAESDLLVGVSGGVDSVCLAAFLVSLKKRNELPNIASISLLHMDHSLRGEESRADAEFVRGLAAHWNCGFEFARIEWQAGEARGQDQCRKKRREFFRRVLRENRNGFLVLAHNENDQAETVLQRLLRGTGVNGLASMRPRNGRVLRPFLRISRTEIETAARALSLTWREDSSNKSTKYERNWIRQEILPLLEARRPGVVRRLAALAEEAQGLASSEIAEKRDELLPLSEARKLSQKVLHERFGFDRKHTERLYRFLHNGKSSRLSLPGGEAWISAGWVWLGNEETAKRLRGSVVSGNFSSPLGVWSAKAEVPLKLRNGSASGKVKRALVKAKVPSFLREAVPLMTLEKELVALLPKRWDRAGKYAAGGLEWDFIPSELAKQIFKTPVVRN